MKTKHLLTALALPAVFAACTAEDIVTENASQAQRVALSENFKMNFGGLESRLSAGEPGEAFKFDFEKGDMVGGAIIDIFVPAATTPSTEADYQNQYTVQDYVFANQPFTYDGSEWTLEHTMVEGKYLFYYPYNEANNSRGAVKYSVPVLQDLSDKETGKFNPKAAVEKYSMAVGFQFLSNEDLSASVELIPIFSYARLVMKLDNSYPGGEVEKVVLQSNGDKFIVNGQIGNTALESIYTAKKTSEDFDWDDYDLTAQFELASTSTYYDKELVRTSPLIVGKVPAGTSMSKDAQNNHSFETYLVVPAQKDLKDLTVYLYTTDGNIYSGDVATTFNGDFNRNTPKKVEVTMVKADVVPYVISSQEDWNASVAMMAKNEVAEFLIADADFALTNESKFPATGKIKVGDIAVSGNNVTIANVEAKNITVNEGAKLTADVTVVAEKIINKGEVIVNKIPESRAATEEVEVPETYWIEAIENQGVLTINKDAVLTWYETETKTEGEGETAVTTITGYNEKGLLLTNKKGATVTVDGTLSVYGTNEGTITDSGTIYVMKGDAVGTTDGEFGLTNNGRETDTVDEELVVLNEPIINITATGKLRADGTLTNNSLVVVEGILSCKNNKGKIINAGTADNKYTVAVIDAKAGSTTYITTNSANGKVVVYSMKQDDLSIQTQNGDVEYTATADVKLDGSDVTNLIANKSIKITWEDAETYTSYALNYLEVTANATIEMVVPENKTETIATVNVVAGKMTLGSDLSVTNLTVAEGASVSVPAETELTIGGSTVANDGTISVVGTLNATNILAGNAGDVEDNGKGTLNWKKTAAEEAIDKAKADYEAELLKALKEWIEAGKLSSTDFTKYKNDLYDYTTKQNNREGIDEAFNALVTSSKRLVSNYDAIQSALKAYNNLIETDATVLGSYPAVAAAYLKEITDSEEYKKFIKTYKLTIPTDSENFFVATTDGTTTKTADTYALEQFKQHVNKETEVEDEYKIVLCSITSYTTAKAYVPDYTFAFVEDNVYKLYDEVIAVFEAPEFSDEVLKTDPVILKGKTTGADAAAVTTYGIVDWVNAAANVKENVASAADAIAREYVTKTVNNVTFALYKESLKWAYTDATIAAIKTKASEE